MIKGKQMMTDCDEYGEDGDIDNYNDNDSDDDDDDDTDKDKCIMCMLHLSPI